METWAFNPLYTNTGNQGTPAGTLVASVTIAATTAAASGALPGPNTGPAKQIEFTNQTAAWAYINLGIAGSVTAATVASSYPIGPGADKVITVSDEVTGWSVILAAGAAAGSVTATRGNGV